MRDYREKQVNGFLADVHNFKMAPVPVTVRMTADKRGKSISLSAANIMIQIPLEAVSDIVKVVEE